MNDGDLRGQAAGGSPGFAQTLVREKDVSV